jgi:ribosomal protein S18 acetylase RimI-like enzyme
MSEFNFKIVTQRWNDFHCLFIFSNDGIASCRLSIYDDTPSEGIISDLYVYDACRQQGYATELLKFCSEVAKANECNSISLRSDNDDWVREWYKRIGFEVESSQVWLKKSI